ncbi:MAG: hypothetical protein JXQ90_16035 [Cyclobacteriaceae bacterium]
MLIVIRGMLLIMIHSFLFLFDQTDWKLSLEKEGIQVYTRETTQSPVNDSKAVVLIPNVDLDQVVTFFLDIDQHKEWMYSTEKSQLLRDEEDKKLAYYQANAPWPVTDRDIVSEFTIRREPDRCIIIGQAQPTLLPTREDMVRITELQTEWTFEREERGVRVTYISQMHPGGSIPAWLANMTATESPFNSLSELRTSFR